MTTPETMGTPEWITIAQAAELLDQSTKTVRRKIKAGELAAEKRHDPSIGQERWMIDASKLPRQPGTAAAVVPVEVLEQIDRLHREITEAIARAERAETTAEFQAERRQELETEAERLRAELEAERTRRWWQRRK